jgi:hypothetical protein
MRLRGDGKANLYQASCFDENIKQEIKTKNCTAGMINPPYSQKDKSGSELDFVYNMLDMLTKGGIGIAIIPISCVIQKNTLKEKLLKHHTLVAVLSMPSDLFYPVGTVTCIVVFQAHIPHKDTNKETWFAYCKDDGHKLLKHQGRVNISWQEIKEKWVYNYKNKKEVAGFSVMKMVTANDEWCAERYMETDYSTLTENDFKNTLHEYTAFLFSNKLLLEPKQQSVQEAKINLDFKSWQSFSYEQIFDIKKCSAYDIEEFSQSEGNIPYITRTIKNNGVLRFVNTHNKLNSGNSIIIGGESSIFFYQSQDFIAGSNITSLYNRKLNKFHSLFITTIGNMEKYRFNYGRASNLQRVKELIIKLPVDSNGKPDWQFMEDYIKSLPYSINL